MDNTTNFDLTPTAPATSAQKASAFLMCAAITEAIRGLGEVPSGHLYARLMDKVDIQTYERIIGVIVGSGLVQKKGDLLRWVGPEIV